MLRFIAVFLMASSVAMATGVHSKCPNFANQSEAHDLAKKLYEEAFIHQMNGEWQKAQDASYCSSMILNGQQRWLVEAQDLL